MRKVKKAVTAAVSLVFCICALFINVSAADSKWDIENTLDVSECKQGGTLLLSVTLKGSSTAKAQEITSLSGIFEYDTSLFTVEKSDILPAEKDLVKDCSFDAAEGKFVIQYDPKAEIKNESSLLQIRLHVAEDASTGKTTVCVTNMEWSGPDSKNKQEIEHRVPANITISESEKFVAGDVNGDGNVNLTDARLAMQHYNNIKQLDSAQQKRADVNEDGNVNLTDVKLMMQYYNGEMDELSDIMELADQAQETDAAQESESDQAQETDTAQQSGTGEKIGSEFVIKNGVLKAYNGSGKNVKIPNGVKKIGNRALASEKIKSVTIPSSVNVIGEEAFMYASIKKITIPKNVNKIGVGAFYGCSYLKEMTILNKKMKFAEDSYGQNLFDGMSSGYARDKITIKGYKASTSEQLVKELNERSTLGDPCRRFKKAVFKEIKK